jgi:high-affinity iron transporter
VGRLPSAVLLAVLSCGPTLAAGSSELAIPGVADRGSEDAVRLVFLLQYVGADYAAAVADGRVVNEAEYSENREFAGQIADLFARLQTSIPAAKAQAIEREVHRIVELVDARGEPRLVREAAESAIPRLVEALALRAFPRQRPDPARARALYAENCTPCHGARGGGDGPRARELDPPPARFTDRVRMSSAAPYVFYNAITLGVANTGMASFADSFSDQERWDLAFYLWTFEGSGDVAPTSLPPVVVSLRDLATRSSKELAPEVMRQAAALGRPLDPDEAERWVAELRAHPPPLSDAQERLARVRQDLAKSVSLVWRGELEQAVDLVTTSYLSEFEPLEPELDGRDTRVRQQFERGLVTFRSALRRADRAAALATAKELEETVDRAAAVLAGRSKRPAARGVMFSLLMVGAAAAIVLYRRWVGKRSVVS